MGISFCLEPATRDDVLHDVAQRDERGRDGEDDPAGRCCRCPSPTPAPRPGPGASRAAPGRSRPPGRRRSPGRRGPRDRSSQAPPASTNAWQDSLTGHRDRREKCRGPAPQGSGASDRVRGGRSQSSSGRRRRPVGEPAGLVLDVLGDLAELVAVLAGVVGAEEQLAAALELYPEVGLGAASVAPVDRGERCCAGGCRSSHVGPRSHSGNCFNDRSGKVFLSLFRSVQSQQSTTLDTSLEDLRAIR